MGDEDNLSRAEAIADHCAELDGLDAEDRGEVIAWIDGVLTAAESRGFERGRAEERKRCEAVVEALIEARRPEHWRAECAAWATTSAHWPPSSTEGPMDFEAEARRVVADLYLPGPTHYFDAAELAVAAALRRAYAEGAKRVVDAVTAEMTSIEAWRLGPVLARLAPPAPKPDEAPNPFARLYGACPDLPEPNPVSQPPAQPNGEGDALDSGALVVSEPGSNSDYNKPVTYRAGTVPDDLDYSRLDEGIRDAVRLVRSHGFATTDSGDGRLEGAKAAMEGTLPFPHVVVRLDDAATMVTETERLAAIGATLGPDWYAELTWSPGGPALAMLICGGWEYGEALRGDEAHRFLDAVCPEPEEPLARDFTEPGGGECGACAGGGVLPRQHPPDCYEDERGPCTACDGTGRAR
jgi:hypothetical protein